MTANQGPLQDSSRRANQALKYRDLKSDTPQPRRARRNRNKVDAKPAFQFLRLPQLAHRLQVSRSWLYQLTRKGNIPCYKINGVILFSESEVRQWILDQPPMRKSTEK